MPLKMASPTVTAFPKSDISGTQDMQFIKRTVITVLREAKDTSELLRDLKESSNS